MGIPCIVLGKFIIIKFVFMKMYDMMYIYLFILFVTPGCMAGCVMGWIGRSPTTFTRQHTDNINNFLVEV